MGVLVFVFVGIVFILFISSVVICMMLSLGGFVGGVVIVGCCC